MSALDYSSIEKRVYQVMCTVFEQPDLRLSSETKASDVKGWDSLGHINLVLALEKEFAIKLRPAKVARLKNVSELVSHMHEKTVA